MPNRLENIAEAFKAFAYQSVEHSKNSPGNVTIMKGKPGLITLMVEGDQNLACVFSKVLSDHADHLNTFVETSGSGQDFTAYTAHFEVFKNVMNKNETLLTEIAQAYTAELVRDNKTDHLKNDADRAWSYFARALEAGVGFNFAVALPQKPSPSGTRAATFAKGGAAPNTPSNDNKATCAIL